jgi:hypothetical protein
MSANWKSAVTVFLILPVVAGAMPVYADEHVVPASELHQSLIDASAQRQDNLSKVRAFFASDEVQRALGHAGFVASRVDKAVSSLDDDELARLAARVDSVRKDIAAGALSNQELTYVVIALATAVIILIIVAAD